MWLDKRGRRQAPSRHCVSDNVNVAGTSSKRRRRNQRRCASDRQRREDERINTLLSSCRKINNLCKTNPTKHTTIMEYLRKRAVRFRNNGRIEGVELEKVLKELADEEDTFRTAILTGSEGSETDESSSSLTDRLRH